MRRDRGGRLDGNANRCSDVLIFMLFTHTNIFYSAFYDGVSSSAVSVSAVARITLMREANGGESAGHVGAVGAPWGFLVNAETSWYVLVHACSHTQKE